MQMVVTGSEVWFVVNLRVPETWHHYSRTDTDPVAFLSVHDDVVYTCLCRADVQKVVGVGENECLSTVASELRLLWSSGRFAKLLLAAPMRQIVSTELEKIVEEGKQELVKAKTVTDSIVTGVYAKVDSAIKSNSAMTLLDGRREVEMVYNGIKFSMQSRTAAHTAEMKIELAIRESATLGGVLPYLLGEKLLHQPGKQKQFDVQATLMVKGGRARHHIAKIIRDTAGPDGMT
eukprot:2741462-Amphidinium_carterae.1